MQLTGFLRRGGDQIIAERTNRDNVDLMFGFIHPDSQQMFTIIIDPSGQIIMSYGKIADVTASDVAIFQLGTITDAGELEIIEPRLIP